MTKPPRSAVAIATASGLHASAFADGANSDAQASGIGDIASVFNTGSAARPGHREWGPTMSIATVSFIFGTGSTAVAGRLTERAIGTSPPSSATCSTRTRPVANFLLDILPSL